MAGSAAKWRRDETAAKSGVDMAADDRDMAADEKKDEEAGAAKEKERASELLPLVYDELRQLARSRMAKERGGLTLQPTALVHEAYLRVAGDDAPKWDRKGHFFAAAAIAMRRILVERARHYQRLKHGGEQQRVSWEPDVEHGAEGMDLADVLAVDEALDRLEQIDPRKAQVVMLRYFAGLSVEETAMALGLSPATVKNEWAFARVWLYKQLSLSHGSSSSSTPSSST
jgi:RNA polymerase sigma factor (TIGR02999 family)